MLTINSVSCDLCKVKSVEPSVVLLYKSCALNVNIIEDKLLLGTAAWLILIVSPMAKPLPAEVNSTAVTVLPDTVNTNEAPVPEPLVVTPPDPTVKLYCCEVVIFEIFVLENC